jgi:PAS domain S-box-containing protein
MGNFPPSLLEKRHIIEYFDIRTNFLPGKMGGGMDAQDRVMGSDCSNNQPEGIAPLYAQPLFVSAMYARAFAINPAAIGIIRFEDGLIIDVNQAWQEMFGYCYQEVRGRSVEALRLWPAKENRSHFIDELRKSGSLRNNEYTVLRKSGESFQVLCSAEFMSVEDETFIVSSWLDITKQKQTDKALRQSENLLRAVIDNSPDAIYVKDRGSRWLMANPTVLAIVGKRAEEAIGKTDLELYADPQIGQVIIENDRHILTQGRSATFEEVAETAGGKRTYLSVKAPWRDEKGEIIGIIGISHDITERKRVEEELRISEKRFRRMFQHSAAGMALLSPDSRFLQVNSGFCKMLGFAESELIGKTFQDITFHEDRYDGEILVRRVLSGEIENLQLEKRYLRKDGSVIWGLASITLTRDDHNLPMHFIAQVQDITERKNAAAERLKLEDQLQQAKKMESVGRLAGGIAHDFNNMLSVILGHTEMALEQSDLRESLYEDLAEIQKAAKRSADLTRQLLAFARKQTIKPIALDLNKTISGMVSMLQRLIGESIFLDYRPAENLWMVMADPSQIDQILANLCVNARDAISDVGKIRIETKNRIIDDKDCAEHLDFVAGEYVQLTVTDNGSGIDKETLEHIFEPFFTTKKFGLGTGLGLATVYGAVKQNNGFITVDSSLEKGTAITIYLPHHKAEIVPAAIESADKPKWGKGTILLVEDEPAILKVASRMLENRGCTLLLASSPGEAIRTAKEHSGEIHLLITDVIMPEMNGPHLAKQLKDLYPNLRCLLMSGYPADVMAKHGVLEDDVWFIQKPFTAQNLMDSILKALENT